MKKSLLSKNISRFLNKDASVTLLSTESLLNKIIIILYDKLTIQSKRYKTNAEIGQKRDLNSPNSVSKLLT